MRKASTAVLAGAWAHVTANAASCGGAWRCVRPPFDLLSICVGETYPDDVRGQARLGGFVSTAYIFSNCAYVFTRILANLRRWLTSVVLANTTRFRVQWNFPGRVNSHIGETYLEDERIQGRLGGYDPSTYQF
ncbi:uncharacterized protein LOC126589848 [Malus sylvestris]|uniref:uncharacterized protein LOC126589848 n=1 Tax=Malus sylvestris TaxID=3752 RepID=UPI0021ABD50F|nr:uncharacterized protein LOC126589848 [Malus sylvestris]